MIYFRRANSRRPSDLDCEVKRFAVRIRREGEAKRRREIAAFRVIERKGDRP
jgi:hypothetical protein